MEQDSPVETRETGLERVQGSNGTRSPQEPRGRAKSRVLQVTVTLSEQVSWRDPEGQGRSIGQRIDAGLVKVSSVVAISDADGVPVATIPTQELLLPLVDTVEYRTLGERIDAANQKAEAQAVDAWETQNHAG